MIMDNRGEYSKDRRGGGGGVGVQVNCCITEASYIINIYCIGLSILVAIKMILIHTLFCAIVHMVATPF